MEPHKISVIHPSRKRPEQAFNTAQTWLNNSEDVFEYILSLDSDDNSNYVNPFIDGITLRNNNRSAVDAINNGAKLATGDILMVISDDFDCPIHWDESIKQQTEGKTDWIAKTWDGIQKWIITLPIMDRTYYNRFGYIYNPDYLHMFCDTELTCVADLTGRKIELDIPFSHNHYSTGKSAKDEVSVKADATWNQGEKLFIERAKRKFDLKETSGKIVSQEYLNWMRMKGVSVR